MILHRSFALLLLATLITIFADIARAQDIPDYVRSEITTPALVGQGTYRWFGLKIYDAVLWGDGPAFRSDDPLAGKFVLELQYARDLQGSKIADRSISEIRELRYGNDSQHVDWLRMMKRIFPDVSEGTRLGGVYDPDIGARFYLDGLLQGEIRDPEFARAFFSIWLDKRTSDTGLRSKLLGAET